MFYIVCSVQKKKKIEMISGAKMIPSILILNHARVPVKNLPDNPDISK